jgi:poly(hydroxyalkanoate) depolymerase family esterase
MAIKMPPKMSEATKLTREGRLAEATSLIQRLLGGSAGPVPENAAATKPAGPVRRADAVDIEPEVAKGTPAASTSSSGAQDTAAKAERAKKRSLLSKLLGRAEQPQPAEPGSLDAGHVSSQHGSSTKEARGAFHHASHSNAAGTRAYRLYVPGSYNGQAVPLIVMLHGCTQSAEDFAAGTAMNTLAEMEGFLVAYPEQSKSANPNRCWNWFNPNDQKRDSGEPSIIAGITREIIANYAIDPSRVYVAGLSAGGAAAAIMASAYPDLFAAAGVHSGLPAGSARDIGSALSAMRSPKDPSGLPHGAILHGRGRLVPTIVFHGDKDATVHPSNGQHVIVQSRTREWGSLRAVAHQGRVPEGHAYTRTDHHDAAGRVVLEMWAVHGAGHAWSGGKPEGSFTDPKGPDASREMVRFFLKHPAPGH